jgi:hypothetical protein
MSSIPKASRARSTLRAPNSLIPIACLIDIVFYFAIYDYNDPSLVLFFFFLLLQKSIYKYSYEKKEKKALGSAPREYTTQAKNSFSLR